MNDEIIYAWSPSSMVARGACTDYASLAKGGEYVPLAEIERLMRERDEAKRHQMDNLRVIGEVAIERDRLRSALNQACSAMSRAHQYIFYKGWQSDEQYDGARKIAGELTQAIHAVPVDESIGPYDCGVCGEAHIKP